MNHPQSRPPGRRYASKRRVSGRYATPHVPPGKIALLAEDLIGPFYQCHQIGWRHEPRVLVFEVVVADRTGP